MNKWYSNCGLESDVVVATRSWLDVYKRQTFDYEYHPATPKYFFSGDHMERFVYSPPCSEKEVITEFAQT